MTNTGPGPLASVGVVDDNGTPGDPVDDFAATPVLDADGFNVGDLNRNGLLDPAPGGGAADLVTYNSGFPEENAAVRARFYEAVGVPSPQIRVDFEAGFADEQNISGQAGLFEGGLVIRDTAARPQAIVQEGPGSIEPSSPSSPFASPSNPVGRFAVSHTPSGFSDLLLDFSSNPVDYVAFQDIDTDANHSRVILTFADGSTFRYALPDSTLAAGDSAEFLGFLRGGLPRITELRLDFSGLTSGIDNLEYGAVPATPAETWTFAATRLAAPGQHANLGTASGTPARGGDPAFATDVDHRFGVRPVALAGRLDPASDTGASDGDGIISDTTPTVFGTTEPGTAVRLIGHLPGRPAPEPLVLQRQVEPA